MTDRTFHVDMTLLRLALERGAAMAMRDELERQFYEQHAPIRLRVNFPYATIQEFDASELMAGVDVPGWKVEWDEP